MSPLSTVSPAKSDKSNTCNNRNFPRSHRNPTIQPSAHQPTNSHRCPASLLPTT